MNNINVLFNEDVMTYMIVYLPIIKYNSSKIEYSLEEL
jgi:hypothetical protein